MLKKATLFFYYILATLLYILFIPILIYKSKQQKYIDSIPARFFLKNNPPFNDGKIMFHACSLGEIKSLKPIVDSLDDKCCVTTTTNTGFSEAKRYYENVRFLPYEIFLPFWMSSFSSVVVLEAELWLMLFAVSKSKGAKTILLNARIHDGSYKRYLKLKWFYGVIFSYIDIVLAQSEVDKERLVKLGAKNVKVVGNIKSFIIPTISRKYEKPNKKFIIIASTHDNEEEMILKNIDFKDDYKVVIAPRHPERFDKIESIAKEFAKRFNINFSKLSEDFTLSSDVILVDIIGELVNLYSIGDIVILGGSFIEDEGGHNPIEPAFFSNVILSGKNVFETKNLYELVENVYFCDYNDIDRLLKSNVLKKAKIKNKNSLEEIISYIK